MRRGWKNRREIGRPSPHPQAAPVRLLRHRQLDPQYRPKIASPRNIFFYFCCNHSTTPLARPAPNPSVLLTRYDVSQTIEANSHREKTISRPSERSGQVRLPHSTPQKRLFATTHNPRRDPHLEPSAPAIRPVSARTHPFKSTSYCRHGPRS